MSLKSLNIHVYISVACCFSFFFLLQYLYSQRYLSFCFLFNFWGLIWTTNSWTAFQILSNSLLINFMQYFTLCTFELFVKASLPFCCPVIVWLPPKISKLKLWPLEQNIFPNIKYHTEACAISLFQFSTDLKGKLHLLIEAK